ncbi:MAG: LysM peptidoglycan-binding domain-containing protein [Kiritimatiellales bacterium]
MKKQILLIPAVLLISSCQTLQTPQSRSNYAAQTEERRIAQANMNRLNGRMENLEFEISQMRQDIDAIRMQFDARCAAIEQKSEADKRQIIANVTGELERQLKTAQPAPSSSPGKTSAYGYEHIVRPGETLSTIAKAYTVTTQAIIDANKIKNPNVLSVGQKLFIPE